MAVNFGSENNVEDVAIKSEKSGVDVGSGPVNGDGVVLLESGWASYLFDAENKQNYYARVQHPDGEIKDLWGLDIKRALTDINAKKGDTISLICTQRGGPNGRAQWVAQSVAPQQTEQQEAASETQAATQQAAVDQVDQASTQEIYASSGADATDAAASEAPVPPGAPLTDEQMAAHLAAMEQAIANNVMQTIIPQILSDVAKNQSQFTDIPAGTRPEDVLAAANASQKMLDAQAKANVPTSAPPSPSAPAAVQGQTQAGPGKNAGAAPSDPRAAPAPDADDGSAGTGTGAKQAAAERENIEGLTGIQAFIEYVRRIMAWIKKIVRYIAAKFFGWKFNDGQDNRATDASGAGAAGEGKAADAKPGEKGAAGSNNSKQSNSDDVNGGKSNSSLVPVPGAGATQTPHSNGGSPAARALGLGLNRNHQAPGEVMQLGGPSRSHQGARGAKDATWTDAQKMEQIFTQAQNYIAYLMQLSKNTPANAQPNQKDLVDAAAADLAQNLLPESVALNERLQSCQDAMGAHFTDLEESACVHDPLKALALRASSATLGTALSQPGSTDDAIIRVSQNLIQQSLGDADSLASANALHALVLERNNLMRQTEDLKGRMELASNCVGALRDGGVSGSVDGSQEITPSLSTFYANYQRLSATLRELEQGFLNCDSYYPQEPAVVALAEDCPSPKA